MKYLKSEVFDLFVTRWFAYFITQTGNSYAALRVA